MFADNKIQLQNVGTALCCSDIHDCTSKQCNAKFWGKVQTVDWQWNGLLE